MPSIRRWKDEGLGVDAGAVPRNPQRSGRLCVPAPWTQTLSRAGFFSPAPERVPLPAIEGLMLKLILQNFGHLMRRTDSLEMTLMLEEKGMTQDGITASMDMSLSKLWELVVDREAWRAAVHESQRVGHDWVAELNSLAWAMETNLSKNRHRT